jgi:transcriptional regulator with XRE-family HTH domain
MQISNALKELILELGISQSEFSKQAKISQPHLSKLLNSDLGISISDKTLEKIQDAFNVEFIVESRFIKRGKLNELSRLMLNDNQPFRQIFLYFRQTIDSMVGQKDDFSNVIIDEEYMIEWFFTAIKSIEQDYKTKKK